jgi:catechol 2,3-dioxygenase-like lactoylglutathione lyase family enzyme
MLYRKVSNTWFERRTIMRVGFVASFAPIADDVAASQGFYRDALGLSFEGGDGDYVFTQRLDGVRHFGIWPLREAAQSCFGTPTWPADLPLPQASIEFEVETIEAVAAAAAELEERGYHLLHGARTEPWTQTITRLLDPGGLLVGVCYTPWFHGEAHGGH